MNQTIQSIPLEKKLKAQKKNHPYIYITYTDDRCVCESNIKPLYLPTLLCSIKSEELTLSFGSINNELYTYVNGTSNDPIYFEIFFNIKKSKLYINIIDQSPNNCIMPQTPLPRSIVCMIYSDGTTVNELLLDTLFSNHVNYKTSPLKTTNPVSFNAYSYLSLIDPALETLFAKLELIQSKEATICQEIH